jgi:acyl-CoA synthetase (NDP forming)
MMQIVSQNAPQANLEGALLMEMAPADGFEFILGSSKDPGLGNMIMVGLGGIFVEILKDVSFGLAPITKTDAQAMLDRIKSKKIFEGVRGKPALDVDALIDCLGRLSLLLTDFPQIVELDINPLLVLPKGQGVRVLDARIILE